MGVGSQKWHRNGPVPENNRNGLEKSSCKPVEQEENHEKGLGGSWARNHMGNASSSRRLWLMRLFAMIFVPLFVLGGLELVLRLAGYGYDTGFFQRIRMQGQDYYVPNEKFGYRFLPPAIARTAPTFRFPAEKATNSYRIFLLGESAAIGDPDSTYGVGRYFEVLLRERYPGTDFQVVCA